MFLPGESQGREAWWAAVYGVTRSQTRLKQLSSSSSSREKRGLRVTYDPGSLTELSLKPLVFFPKDSVLIAELRCGLQAWTIEVRGGACPGKCKQVSYTFE